ncbi:carnitine O-palmitoyltransferase 1 [Clonorchis sinensis]|uniref:carnitine O-palmitoyltransferase n=2 Tax=Clonorchis sinensis TaxID=79923 RepID=G7YNI7_CLOSI|nr:carnitine O-palmitoyltransferase 1 [Clonorchis sinensis]
MYATRKRTNWYDMLWMYLVTLFKSKHPRLYGYQYSLPNLPLPSLRDTIDRYLLSVRHLLPLEEYEERVRQAELFRKGPGRKLQFFLWMKTWFTSNYVTDWWEDYVYLASREPIMANSNFYGVQWKFTRTVQPTQSARAALLTYLFLKVREQITREELEPLLVNKLVPLCSWQYERPFNTTRIPCLEKDKLIHLSDSNHIAVYHRGRFYRCPVLVDGHHLSAAEFEYMFNRILYFDDSPSATGEEKLAAFTAGPRDAWAIARSTFFSSGINRTSLDAIERAAFFVALDDEQRDLDSDVNEDLSYLGKTFLTGNCYNRWFDKSFTLIVLSNSSCGFNAEHSWGDAPILSHLIELICAEENVGIEQNTPGLHYTASGSCDGPVSKQVWPTRLRWDIPPECVQAMEASYNIARSLADSIDLYVMRFRDFGSGFMKKAGFSPDAFMQISLQLAYFMDTGNFALVYESSMTRIFREGRTETVRSCSAEVVKFIRAISDNSTTTEHCIELLRDATNRHVRLVRDAISGKGVDRHLFALYVVSKFLHMDDQFLKKVLSDPWRLSTSQTPINQTGRLSLPADHPDIDRGCGGGFGPVDKNGYGVSYIFASDNCICLHISSSFGCPDTSSERFARTIGLALNRIRALVSAPRLSSGVSDIY